jgi:[ribosomal protein S5]-alanine N-acetyltransferase
MIKPLQSEELILKEFSCADITMDYINWLNDKEINKYLESRFIYQDLNTVKDFVSNCEKNDLIYLFGVFTKNNMKHIGNIKVGPINKRHNIADIGILIGDKKFWGKGIATQAITVLIDFGFNQLNLEKITAGCYEKNTASKKAFEKAGFKVEGFFRNHVNASDVRQGVWKLGCLRTDLAEGI